jgi:hypothetical protein
MTAIQPETPAIRRTAAADPRKALRPMVLDIAVPLASYYILHAAGCGVVESLVLASVLPAARSVIGLVRNRTVNTLAALIVTVNLASMGLSLATGSPRLMLLKDSGVTSVLGVSVLVSVLADRPLMSAGLRPFLVRDSAARAAAFDRLSATSDRFRRLEKRFSLTWGAVLLVECAVRAALVFILPVGTMVWLSTVLMVAAIAVGIVNSYRFSHPMETMVDRAVEPLGGR